MADLSVVEVVGPYTVDIKLRGGAYTNLGHADASGRARFEPSIRGEEIFTDESGLAPDDVLHLGTVGLLTLTMNKFDRALLRDLHHAVPRLTSDALVANSYHSGTVGLRWSETAGAVAAASGFFSVKITPLLAGVSRISREFPKCYLLGDNPWSVGEIGNTPNLVSLAVHVLRDLNKNLMIEAVIP